MNITRNSNAIVCAITCIVVKEYASTNMTNAPFKVIMRVACICFNSSFAIFARARPRNKLP